MTDGNDFASMMEAFGSTQAGRGRKRLKVGESVEGPVVQISKDYIFVDVGATVEGRIDRGELEDKKGELTTKLGDVVRARVANLSDLDGPKLVTALGRGGNRGAIDLATLESAKAGNLPVEGTVQKAVKGGLEVSLGGLRAFCPASQVDTTFISDLAPFEGQQLFFRVLEIKEGGRKIVISRRALIEKEREMASQELLARLAVGGDYDGTVQTVQPYGAFVDLGGGVEGLIHISELTHGRVDRVEDVLSVGERVTVRILAIEPSDKGPLPKLRLSLKARIEAPEGPKLDPGEVLVGTVSKLSSAGVFVETPKGTGLVPVRELGLPRGADFRRSFPVGTAVRVVLVNHDHSGRLTFSFSRVAGVEERSNYAEFAKSQSGAKNQPQHVGSFGALLASKLGLEVPEPEAPPPPVVAASHQRQAEASGSVTDAPKIEAARVAAVSQAAPSGPSKPVPVGVVRRDGRS